MKFAAQQKFLLEETAADYQTVTLPHLEQEQLSLEVRLRRRMSMSGGVGEGEGQSSRGEDLEKVNHSLLVRARFRFRGRRDEEEWVKGMCVCRYLHTQQLGAVPSSKTPTRLP